MNLTLSADANLIRHTREYAKQHGTTLNNLIREYMENVDGTNRHEKAASEFAALARNHAGKSAPDFTFNREEAHQR